MREISKDVIVKAVKDAFYKANIDLADDVKEVLLKTKCKETNVNARRMLDIIIANFETAEQKKVPLCQDTGMAVVFVEWGTRVILQGGGLEEAINEGVRLAYSEGYLRKSVVNDPLRRQNTLDNTPAVIHTRIVEGKSVNIKVVPKGFGSENMSGLRLFNPTSSWVDVEKFIVGLVKQAGGDPCPPLILGIGIGGTMEKAALLAKEALLRKLGSKNPDPFWDKKERSLLRAINATGIGPQGIGGDSTALACHIKPFPTHIAGLPVAVNFCCHALRHKEIVI